MALAGLLLAPCTAHAQDLCPGAPIPRDPPPLALCKGEEAPWSCFCVGRRKAEDCVAGTVVVPATEPRWPLYLAIGLTLVAAGFGAGIGTMAAIQDR